MKMWFRDWRLSPFHKLFYEIAISSLAAVLVVASLERLGLLAPVNRQLVLASALLTFGAVSRIIRFWFWRRLAPYITRDIALRLASPEAVAAPWNARIWLYLAGVTLTTSVMLLVTSFLNNAPIWELKGMFDVIWFAPAFASFFLSKPFNKILKP